MRNTTVKLYKGVPLEYNNENTFYFASVNDQNAYFASKLWRTVTAAPLHREGVNSIRINYNISQCYDLDYLSFINADHQNKLYYAFVTHVNYISETVSEVIYKIDFMQTWLFETKNNMLNCFIERNTVATDTNTSTIRENFDLGDFKCNYGIVSNISELDELVVMVQTSFDVSRWTSGGFIETAKYTPKPFIRSGMLDTSDLVAFDYRGFNSTTYVTAFDYFMSKVNLTGSGVTVDDILNVWLYPKNLITTTQYYQFDSSQFPTVSPQYNKMYTNISAKSITYTPTISGATLIDGYQPNNKKLYQYPFVNVVVSNNNGNEARYNYEYFTNSTPVFKILGTTTAEAKTRLVPTNYKGVADQQGASIEATYDTSEAIDSAPYPMLPLLSDAYLVWLSQNRHTVQTDLEFAQIRNGLNFANNVSNAIGTGGTPSAAISTSMNIFSNGVNQMLAQAEKIASFEDKKLTPNTYKGVQSEGLSVQHGKLNYTVSFRTIDAQHAKSIDDFFTMYGYPIKAVQAPTINNRTRFTYIKCIGFKTNGAIPQNEREIVENCFNSGVRFWNDRVNFGDFSIANSEYS